MSGTRVMVRSLALLVALSFAGIAETAHANHPQMNETRLTTDTAAQSRPAVSGSSVVYQDLRNGNNDIYLYDLTTGIETRLTSDPFAQTLPAISGANVVYQDMRNGNSDIYAYNLTTRFEKRLTTDSSFQGDPAISGTKVVYQDLRNSNSDIYAYDLATNTETRLTSDDWFQGSPSISGTKVVYHDNRNGNYEIYLYDLSTNVEKRLTNDVWAQLNPSISSTKVVYEDDRYINYDIYLYDLATDTQQRLVPESSYQYAPSISGAKVVYHDNRNGHNDIYLYDLVAGREYRLTTDASQQSGAVISGSKIIFVDNRHGNNDIYSGDLVNRAFFSVWAPSVVGYGATTTVTGGLGSMTGVDMIGKPVVLEISNTGSWWTRAGLPQLTDAYAGFTLVSPALTSARYLRVTFLGDEHHISASSSSVLVKPKASLGTPVAPSTMYRTRTYTVYGNLKPRHRAGSSAGRLYCYRYESGKWRLRKTLTANAYNYSSYSRYNAAVRLPYSGKWRMRAYHADAGHAGTYSGWRYVTVK